MIIQFQECFKRLNLSPYSVALSRLKRTAALAPIMQWMGLGNEATDPNMPPPSDSSILMAYYGKMMAKQRWSKAHNALGKRRRWCGLNNTSG